MRPQARDLEVYLGEPLAQARDLARGSLFADAFSQARPRMRARLFEGMGEPYSKPDGAVGSLQMGQVAGRGLVQREDRVDQR